MYKGEYQEETNKVKQYVIVVLYFIGTALVVYLSVPSDEEKKLDKQHQVEHEFYIKHKK